MDSKQKIKFDLKKVLQNEVNEIDGIAFSNIAYVLVFVGEINLFTQHLFQDSFLVFKELKNSISKSGKYLLFTSVSGIADDAGWEYVEVLHEENSVTWNIQRDNILLSYVFDRKDYLKEILMIEKKIKNLNSNMKLEPSHVVYPE